jgi:hypothetical protein
MSNVERIPLPRDFRDQVLVLGDPKRGCFFDARTEARQFFYELFSKSHGHDTRRRELLDGVGERSYDRRLRAHGQGGRKLVCEKLQGVQGPQRR